MKNFTLKQVWLMKERIFFIFFFSSFVFSKLCAYQAVSDDDAINYLFEHPDGYVAISFPSSNADETLLEQFLLEEGDIIYKKNIELNKFASQNLIRECYKHDGHSLEHLDNLHRFIFPNTDVSIIVYVYKSDSAQRLLETKQKIRKYFSSKQAIHATDNQQQSLDLARLLLQKNGMHFLTHRKPDSYLSMKNFITLFSALKGLVPLAKRNQCVIDGSAILAAYGLRDCHDIDFFQLPGYIVLSRPEPFIDSHLTELEYHESSLEQLIMLPNNYFYYDDFKFLSLKQLFKMKKNRYSAQKNHKDLCDLELMAPMLSDN